VRVVWRERRAALAGGDRERRIARIQNGKSALLVLAEWNRRKPAIQGGRSVDKKAKKIIKRVPCVTGDWSVAMDGKVSAGARKVIERNQSEDREVLAFGETVCPELGNGELVASAEKSRRVTNVTIHSTVTKGIKWIIARRIVKREVNSR
jgi:hypothetical protein